MTSKQLDEIVEDIPVYAAMFEIDGIGLVMIYKNDPTTAVHHKTGIKFTPKLKSLKFIGHVPVAGKII